MLCNSNEEVSKNQSRAGHWGSVKIWINASAVRVVIVIIEVFQQLIQTGKVESLQALEVTGATFGPRILSQVNRIGVGDDS